MCLFCNIANGSIPANKVYEDDEVVAFHDINPVAPIHILVIPRRHIASAAEFTDEDASLIGRMHVVATGIADEMGFAEPGYRTVMNCNRDGGQTVFHVHLHLLAGRGMHWPPG